MESLIYDSVSNGIDVGMMILMVEGSASDDVNKVMTYKEWTLPEKIVESHYPLSKIL